MEHDPGDPTASQDPVFQSLPLPNAYPDGYQGWSGPVVTTGPGHDMSEPMTAGVSGLHDQFAVSPHWPQGQYIPQTAFALDRSPSTSSRSSPVPQKVAISRNPRARVAGPKQQKASDALNEGSSGKGTKPQSKAKTRTPDIASEHDSPRLACPYHKLYPERYKYSGACAGPGFRSITRLKEHLFRKHRLPDIYCPLCFEEFDSQKDKDEHAKARVCSLRPVEQRPFGLNQEMERRLRSRHSASSGLTDEAKWAEMFRILFPYIDETKLPSPYFDPRDCEPDHNETSCNPDARMTARLQKVMNRQHESFSSAIREILKRGEFQENIQQEIEVVLRHSHLDALRSLEIKPDDEQTVPGRLKYESTLKDGMDLLDPNMPSNFSDANALEFEVPDIDYSEFSMDMDIDPKNLNL